MRKIVLIVVIMMFGVQLQAQDKNAKATIEVDGVCMMCKERIEKAAIKTKGVKSAVWDVQTHMLSLIYDERKTSLDTIHQRVADVGHDTEKITATEKAYNSIHACCKYRDEAVVDEH
ncbi:heavy-metal-associated domain-containing protein [uncultured Planktosalinus sp.]|uniref:heavy-metal-associated domain-containing protein n=1 Tax=uncultured Planktosalinus sp. TaxID=1810935 RepID=UPI0030DC4543